RRSWCLDQPLTDTNYVYCYGGQDVLKMGLGHASVTRAPHPEGTDRLRDRSFHSRSLLVLFFEFLALLAAPSCLPRFVFCLRADCDRSPQALGSSAMDPARARLAVETRELDLDHLIVHMIYSRCPAQTRLTRRASRLLFVPVNAKTLRIKPAPGLRLPVIVGACRAIKIDPILAGDAHQQFRFDIACVNEVCAWK